MKKRNLTMDKQIGIYGLALLVFLVICGSQDVLALTDISTNPVILNVNAATQVAPALTKGMVNKFTYVTTPGGLLQNVLTNWTEKAVFGSVIAATGLDEPVEATLKVTVTVKAPTTSTLSGDLIIKVDMLTATTTSGGLSVLSYWLQRYTINGLTFTGLAASGETPDGGSEVRFDSLPSQCLYTDMALTTAGTTITLLEFPVKLNQLAHIIFTAVLVDDANSANPQVMGVDVKTMYLNYVDPDADYADYKPIWLYLVKAKGTNGS